MCIWEDHQEVMTCLLVWYDNVMVWDLTFIKVERCERESEVMTDLLMI